MSFGVPGRSLPLLAALWCGLSLSAWAQTPKAAPATSGTAKKPTFTDFTLVTRDQVQLHGTYFPSSAGQNSPVVVLLHGKSGNRLAWQANVGQAPGFAQALQTNEFAVVSVDLRHHGENIAATPAATASSKKPDAVRLTANDYKNMVAFDLEAVKKFLFEEHQKQMLNMNKLAIVGVEFSCAVALVYTELDWSKEPYDDAPVPLQRTPRGQDVRALVLLSPDASVAGLVTPPAVQRVRALQMPVMIGVGKKDSLDKGAAKKLADAIMPKIETKEHVFLQQYDTKFRGLDLLGKGLGVEQQMYKFLDEYVKKTPGEWRNRKSPLTD